MCLICDYSPNEILEVTSRRIPKGNKFLKKLETFLMHLLEISLNTSRKISERTSGARRRTPRRTPEIISKGTSVAIPEKTPGGILGGTPVIIPERTSVGILE